MSILNLNCYNFKDFSGLAQTISFSCNCAYLKNAFLTILTDIWQYLAYTSVSYTMVYINCFGEVKSHAILDKEFPKIFFRELCLKR